MCCHACIQYYNNYEHDKVITQLVYIYKQSIRMSQKRALPSYITSQHYIDGILNPKFISADPEHIEKVNNFPLRPDDTFVTCYPKSGTHWLMKIVLLIVNNGDDQYVQRAPQLFNDYQWFEAAGMPGYPGLDKIHDLPSPRLFFGHQYYSRLPGGPPNTTQARYIYCARNPKDVAVSFYHHSLKRSGINVECDLSWDEFLDHFLRGEVSFGSWWEHIPKWWAHRDEPNVLFLKYEDMKKDLPISIKTISDFLGYNIDQDTLQKIAQATTIESMKVNSVAWSEKQFLRKGVVGDWKNHFTPAQSEAMDKVYCKVVEGTGLEFEFN